MHITKLMKSGITLLLLWLSPYLLAQQFGANPSTLQWKQIDTDTVKIIFPSTEENTANRVASIIHELQKKHTTTIGNKLQKLSIVLQNQTTLSNAYVALGPYRSEFYLFPPQNAFELGALAWQDNLSLHEYRHVQQYNNFNVGLSKFAGFLFGQQGRDLANATAIPDWFFEGDAVLNETLLSHQGRGRLPDFFKGYVALNEKPKKYNFLKLRNGSFKHFIPDHYKLGYLLVAYGSEKYGADFWKKVTQDAARFKPLIYPWQNAVKKYSGISYHQFVKDAFAFYERKWKTDSPTPLHYITTTQKNNVVDYTYPYADDKGNIIVLKKSYKSIPCFYSVSSTGVEEKIGVRDIAYDDYFSYNNGLIVYSSYKADRRWGYREYSDIKLLHIATKNTSRISTNKRLFSPDISHDGKKVVAVEINPEQQSFIVIMNLHGDILYRSKAERGIIYSYPKFSANDNFIYVFTRNGEGKMALEKIDVTTSATVELIPFSDNIFGMPTVQNDTLFFTSSYKDNNEAWAYIGHTKSVYRIAKNRKGLYHPVKGKNNALIVSNFTADGYRLATIEPADLLWEKLSGKDVALVPLYVNKVLTTEGSNTLSQITNRTFTIANYKKGYKLFNFHSWRPEYSDPDISFTLLSENILNTLKSEISYTYNRNEISHSIGFKGIYGGWYLQPQVGINQTLNRRVQYNDDTSFLYNEFNVNAGIVLPLNFTANKNFTRLTFASSINNQQVQWRGAGSKILQNQNFYFVQNSLRFTSQIQQAKQHIYPRMAQQFLVQHRTVVQKYSAYQLLATGALYLPGLQTTHNVVVTAAYQQRDTMGQFSFSNNFPFSRGYAGLNFPRMFKVGTNYHFPLLYPDLGFGHIVYCKRIRLNAFYDYSRVKSLRTGNTFNFRTTGGELYFDTRWWNQENITFGIRYSYLLDASLLRINSTHWEVILPIQLY